MLAGKERKTGRVTPLSKVKQIILQSGNAAARAHTKTSSTDLPPEERTGGVRRFLVKNFIWVLNLALIVFFSISVPRYFPKVGNFINIVNHMSWAGLLIFAVGFVVIPRKLDLSLDSNLVFSAYVGAILMTSYGLNPILGIFVVLGVGAAIGAFNGVLVGKLNINPFLQTLAGFLIFRGLVVAMFPYGIYPLPDAYCWLGKAQIGGFPVSIIVFAITVFILHVMMTYTKFGRGLYATGGDAEAARVSGVNVTRSIVYSYVIAGFLAGLAGLLISGRLKSVVSGLGQGLVFDAVTGAILGGVSLDGGEGTTTGMLGGVLFLGILDSGLNLANIHPYFIQAIRGVLIFVALLVDQLKTRYLAKYLM